SSLLCGYRFHCTLSSSSAPDGAIEKVVIVLFLRRQQVLQGDLAFAEAFHQPEVPKPLQSRRKDDEEIGGMAGRGAEGMGHMGRNDDQISFPSGDDLFASEDLQFAVDDVEEFG